LQGDSMTIPFPAVLPEVHSGIPLGNGVAGALVWSDRGKIFVTFNRSDYWDHRGSLAWNEGMYYPELVDLLHSGRASDVVARFRKKDSSDIPERPTRLPMGRLELDLPDTCRVRSARLELLHGQACLELEDVEARRCTVRVSMKGTEPVCLIAIEGDFSLPMRAVPSNPPSESASYGTSAWRLPAPVVVKEDADSMQWTQAIPGGAYLAVDVVSAAAANAEQVGKIVRISCAYDETAPGALISAGEQTKPVSSFDILTEATREFWQRYWDSCALVRTNIPELDRQYFMGMYRLGASSVEGFDATGLQGPWIEDHRMPPWSGDFHLNVNLQECYWPSLSGNCISAARPLVDFVLRQDTVAKEYARYLAGVDNGYHLPHAVDDAGACMGGFWTGSIDHGSTAWLVHTVVEFCRYTHRIEHYRDIAISLLCKVLRVSAALLTRGEDGSFRYEVSVSPELGGAGEDAWGVNASYQLAAIHACARDLRFSVRMIGSENLEALRRSIPDLDEMLAFAALVGDRLPRYARPDAENAGHNEIFVFDGHPLPHSHRHHSHLAGVWPLQTVDAEGIDAEAVRHSLKRWVRLGCGEWSGWSFPWASIIHSHTGSPDAALQSLLTFLGFFTNAGYATTHDARRPGITVLDGRPDIMQLEAGLGFSAAVLELIARTDQTWWNAENMQELQGYCIATDLPVKLEKLSFSGIRLPGAIRVHGEINDHSLVRLELESETDCRIHLTYGPDRVQDVIPLVAGRSVRVV
ncbi:MAG: glycosyl hydrolase family 95 catalytic domain-containing protein, partial [Spirochaetaceae bacterium]